MKSPIKSVDIFSLVQQENGNIHIPEGMLTTYESKNGPLVIPGGLTIDGKIEVSGNKRDKVEIVAHSIINNGSISSKLDRLVLRTTEFQNHGQIDSAEKFADSINEWQTRARLFKRHYFCIKRGCNFCSQWYQGK